jgi:NAD-dependent SIR2 family protein deacetylase
LEDVAQEWTTTQNLCKGDETMEENEADNVVGMHEQDRSVKCRECMNQEDWRTLTQENAITRDEIEANGWLFYCDYCEEKL